MKVDAIHAEELLTEEQLHEWKDSDIIVLVMTETRGDGSPNFKALGVGLEALAEELYPGFRLRFTNVYSLPG